MSNEYTAADMTTARIKGYQDRVEAEQNAAVQEAVDFYVCDDCGHHYMEDGVTCDCSGRSTPGPLRHIRMAPVVAAPVDAPSLENSHAMGAKGAPASEAERLAFEAWMRGHCWALHATWNGTGYVSDAEQAGGYCPHATRTRGLWAAWRDRAALTSTPAAPGIDLSEIPRYTLAHGDFESEMLEHSRGAWVRLGDVESALIDASPKGDIDDSALLDWLDQQMVEGCAPAIVNDDDGRWAYCDSGASPVPEEGGHKATVAITAFADPETWKPSIREAIQYAMQATSAEAGTYAKDLAELDARLQAKDDPKGGGDAEVMQLRYQLNSLRQLLSGFDVAVQRNPLQPPCTYLEEVRLSHEFQPGEGHEVAAALRNALNQNNEGAKQ